MKPALARRRWWNWPPEGGTINPGHDLFRAIEHTRPAKLVFLALCLALGGYSARLARAADYYLQTSYQNYSFSPGPPGGACKDYFGTNASTLFFCGHVLGDTNSVRPVGGAYGLDWSAFGQPIESVQADLAIGDCISPPPGALTNLPPANFVAVKWGDNAAAYYECAEPKGAAFWVPSTGQIIAAQANNLAIVWNMTNQTTYRQILNVSAVPVKRPARLFWTEKPYDAPKVNMSGLFPIIHYNASVTAPVAQVTTVTNGGIIISSTNFISGVWLDDSKQLCAKSVSGLFVIEYYQEGSYRQQVQPDGIEVVEVLEPNLQLVEASVGARLKPIDTYWANLDGINGLIPNVTHGITEGTAYQHDQTGPKDNWVFAIKRTWSEPWTLEIYWQHKGRMGVLWPYEVDWYSCDWPLYPQRYALGDDPPNDTAPVLIPPALTAELMEDMEPQLHASISASGRSFTATEPGLCLLKYTTHDDIWFEVVQSLSHTNEIAFDLDPVDWPIGEELTPRDVTAHALRFDGVNDYVTVNQGFLNALTNWTVALWFRADRFGDQVLYSEGVPATTFNLALTTNGQVKVEAWNKIAASWSRAITTNAPVQSNRWHHVAVSYTGGTDTAGTMRLYLDNFSWETNMFHRVSADGTKQTLLGAQSVATPNKFYQGKLSHVRVWNTMLTSDQVRSNCFLVAADTAANLVADFPLNEGEGDVVHDRAGGHDGTAINRPIWSSRVIPIGAYWADFPGYIYVAAGNRYNINRYDYPTETAPDSASYVFAVNTGLLEVWWASRSRQVNMPAVYYPSRVQRYNNIWPTDPPEIVIASDLGSSGNSLTAADEALSFNGANTSCVITRYNEVMNSPLALTFEAWVKLANPGASQFVLQRSGQFYLAVSGGTVTGYFNVPDGRYFSAVGGSVPTNQWVHVCCAIGGGNLTIYLNGQRVGNTGIGGWQIRSDLTSDLYIGRGTSVAPSIVGSIGEVRIWNKARTAQEIAATWRTPLAGDEPGLVVYYPFRRGDSPYELRDAGPYRLHGAIYDAVWTTPGHPILEAGPLVLGSSSVYFQNDPALAGYNPNEEHALFLSGVAYALRNDLNTAGSSEPYVLVDYLDPATARPGMKVFTVMATNEFYTFDRKAIAGNAITPIMPLSAMPLCALTDSTNKPPAWRDRKLNWWAVSAGDDGNAANAVMQYYYQMQPTFCFPSLSAEEQPAIGQELPLLPNPSFNGGTTGTPVPVTYRVVWPDNPPELYIGQTLTLPTHGLPDIWNQLSVDIEYDQSMRTNGRPSVTLFDPIADRAVGLDYSVVKEMVSSELARQELTSKIYRFPDLPPSLYPRLFYDPDRGQLVLRGQRIETLTGTGYLLLNLLEAFEKQAAAQMAAVLDTSPRSAWNTAIADLPADLLLLEQNVPYVKAALGARLTNGVGYVTLAFNNSTNRHQVPSAQPVSLSVIKVVPKLYSGELEVIYPDDALAEQLSLRYSADLAGQIEEAEFEWRWTNPIGGLIPDEDFEGSNWSTYGSGTASAANEVTLTGASDFTLTDHYFAARYRPVAPTGPTGANWSEWSYNLAPGWVKRAMTGINPFVQIFTNMVENTVDTRVSMISQAGGPYEGDVALNLNAASSSGLIATYQTIFNRAKAFGFASGTSDDNLNQTLLFAATRLHDLYMLLGNEAYADAQDPTIAFPISLAQDEHGAEATSIFPFMNQVPNLLEEELALLRGRDATLEPSVETSPIYNRLIWNFTQGINGGEPAYAYNYNLRGTPTNAVGAILAEDAKRLYPQGHGDAWGHYLSAISPYYDLLSYPNFRWHTEPEATLLGNAPVSVDYLDEQKFAETAAARARTGAEVVKETFRQTYSEDPNGRWPAYHDSDTARAWGLGDWASRAGQAAYFDWAVANSLLLDHLTNVIQIGGTRSQSPEGIQKIDRASTPELKEIASNFREIQNQVDSANGGLNPLGLARNVVPFDIDPAAIDAGQTHFEQMYSRALQALYNACVAFDHARNTMRELRAQSDSLYDLEEALAQNEIDYHNRLIELYGYPYPDDIGAGKTYPQGYDGPDLINWRILDLENLLVNAPTDAEPMEVEVRNLVFVPGSQFEGHEYDDYQELFADTQTTNQVVGTVTVYVADNGLQVKPSDWAGRRPALGELQLALSDYVQTWYALEAKMNDYDQALTALETDIEHRLADYERYPNEWKEDDETLEAKKKTLKIVAGLKAGATASKLVAEFAKSIGETGAEYMPFTTTGAAPPFPITTIMWMTKPAVELPIRLAYWGTILSEAAVEIAADQMEAEQAKEEVDLEMLLKSDEYYDLLRFNTAETMDKLKNQYVKRAELFAQVEALSQSDQRVEKLLAEGQRLLTERSQVRVRAAQRIQSQRYADLSFRIFRDDALRRYQSTFDLAARYTYLAAKAYDYETGLLYSDTDRTPGAWFLEDVVRARLPGRFYVWLGTPMVGGAVGEPGLADVLARMKADWDVVKGRFGFNNPDNETSRFSLRTELFRISLSSSNNPVWSLALENCKVADLRQLPEFRRYCRPFADTTNAEPGIAIEFPTFVIAGKNYFGLDLAGGDNAYDPSHFATKIRSAGVWFKGYNVTFNTNVTGAGLANEPRVYLVPVGEDVLRSPTGGPGALRHWTVLNQAMPLPYNVGAADLDDQDWIPVIDSLREPLGQIRRFASFRAYHDRGQFDEAETHSNGRLVGRSVWNTRWLLIIPGRTLLADPNEGVERFIHGAAVDGGRDGLGVVDILVFFQTYSIGGD
ncbi:MAG TPA: LamG domain-containing protein [Candidatus Paceibacterota bacterium]|nr:LamG domain-containing protein [Verrucomicrobiota bacterium]HOX03191.1 LamG domain-containing protein [Verrucomicrobiota bacterium]HRZ46113.1 LamG domain-containing protein [Candidatus Paceibacterota bacterium]HRZ54079.1 LamG domain-containing protein [Candidatus Paceibacterota bacterium]